MPQKANLLIIDDEANTLASLSRAFRIAGHEATVCDSAIKALELAKTQVFDLIFSDVIMPGKDGLSFLADLKAQGVSSPVVMMSGQAHIDMAVRATRLGPWIFLKSQSRPTNCFSPSKMRSNCSASSLKTVNFCNALESMS